jgi:hypothetical protein
MIYVFMYLFHVYIHVCRQVLMYTVIYVCSMYKCIYISYTYIPMYVCIHVRMYVCQIRRIDNIFN